MDKIPLWFFRRREGERDLSLHLSRLNVGEAHMLHSHILNICFVVNATYVCVWKISHFNNDFLFQMMDQHYCCHVLFATRLSSQRCCRGIPKCVRKMLTKDAKRLIHLSNECKALIWQNSCHIPLFRERHQSVKKH